MSRLEALNAAMEEAVTLAKQAGQDGDVPVGALVIAPDGHIVGRGWNTRETRHDPTGHAEIAALREAGEKLGTWNLSGCTLVVTLEPCTMCAGAAVNSRVSTIAFGAWEPKSGACGSVRDVVRDARLGQPIEVVAGVMEQKVKEQLRTFFEKTVRET